ncbi:pyruvate formate-lyase-activating protein [Microaceticoccus formicicus]|uniref:pyruvate formate-lyase-activating protein n=1 Tax=Microaceticoccus formicicus TaxID=3118105 RepID=UPI003CD024CA|nr:pyruvate formate-lyase-activating protein [Peptoniphilaceae bacterium AMB_02]
MIKGRLHSIQTMGLLDGPGVRTVFFLQGCPLRCIYCHNPDSQRIGCGEEITVEDVLNTVKKYRPYYGNEGGVTFSGGEPLNQPEFLLEALKTLKREGFNTCIDTSGFGPPEYFEEILKYSDTVLLDIKSFSNTGYLEIAGVGNGIFNKFIKTVKNSSVSVIIRHVMVPGYTDNKSSMDKLINYISPIIKQVERVEILPFHKMGEEKYTELGLNYTLTDVPEMDKTRALGFEYYVNRVSGKFKRMEKMKKEVFDQVLVDKWMSESHLFKNLTKDERTNISKLIEFRRMNRGELIFKSFDRADRLFMVCNGKIKIYENTLDGKEQIMYIYSEREFIGGLNLLRDTDYIYNGECIEPGVIGVIRKEVFDTFLKDNPEVLLRILKMSFERIRLAEDMIRRLTTTSTDVKVAALLLKMIPEFGHPSGSSIILHLSMTREELGSLVGLTRETITRKLGELKDQGIIELESNKTIIIHDANKLREISEA